MNKEQFLKTLPGELPKEDLSKIAGQKPVITKFKKSISNFKTRKGTNAGIKVTLRKDKMYEFVEGTMINSWYDTASKSWRISSKSILDANNTFSEKQTKSFHDLFFESCHETRFSLDMLDTNQCYSFVFKHPENRIINKVNKRAFID